jgi:4-hydroxy-tetrahydrodipicolinate reductase
MNAFLYIVRQAGAMFNTLPEYDLFLHEEHHKDKTDSPSGTALALARILLQTIQRKNEVLNGIPEGKIRPEQLHVTSTRGGTIVGMHRVVFDSAADQIELVHTAKNRSGFAHGALLAAEWVRGKRGMFTMEDVIEDLLQKGEKRER